MKNKNSAYLKARPYFFFLLAALLAFGTILFLEVFDVRTEIEDNYTGRGGHLRPLLVPEEKLALTRTLPEPVKQTDENIERQARVAWAFFENNTIAETGLVNSADKYPSTTMWDTASYFNGIVSAEAIGIIDREEAGARLEKALISLAALPLVEGKLPNKAYHTRSLAMVDYNNKASANGIGWSAIDIARILTSFRIVDRHFPGCSKKISEIIASWDLTAMSKDGLLVGSRFNKDGSLEIVQEGRVGYEQYAALGAMLSGLNVLTAASPDINALYKPVEGILVPSDKRDHKRFQANTLTTSEPYMLTGLEFGYNHESADLSWRLLSAQEKRWERTGHVTAVSEGHVKGAPHFLYTTVLGNGDDWAVLASSGKRYDELRNFSTKAAFAWAALFDTNYTRILLAEAEKHSGPRGFFSGHFEKTGEVNEALDANTNGVVLESLYYRIAGPLMHVSG